MTKPPRKLFVPDSLPQHESGVRRMVADATGAEYVPLRSLSEAQAAPDGVVVLEGDYGGQIYVVARATLVRCSEEGLHRLLKHIDAGEWDDPDGARVYFERHQLGGGVLGGMGGGRVTSEVWVHPRLEEKRSAIVAVLKGDRSSLTACESNKRCN